MNTFEPDTDVLVSIPLVRDGEPFLPDTGSVTYTLRGHTGVLISSGAVTMDPASTFAKVTILAADNSITERFEKRTVVVNCTQAAQPYSFRKQYRLIAFLNHSVTKEDIRNFVGVEAGELPDSSVDIEAAYLAFEAMVGDQTILSDALQAGDLSEQQANNGIIAQATLALLPALAHRISLQESDGPASAQRQSVDLARLEGRARAVISEAVGVLTNNTSPDLGLLGFATVDDIFEA